MHMRSKSLGLALLGSLLVFASVAAAAADRPYKDGTVTNVSSIRTEPGMFDAYMQYLATTYKAMMEEQKAAGIIVSYQVYTTTPRGPDEPDIYLVTEYKNMAALDGLRDKVEPIQQKMFGDQAQRSAKTIERGKMRTALGSELLRKIELK
jgi:hypothetical protein